MADTERLVEHALALLRSDVAALSDAQAGSNVGNTQVGGVMSMTLQVPRQVAEHAVAVALARMAEKDGDA
jgi:hypothetical protein